VFVFLQLFVWGIAMELDPAGFDDCDSTYPPGPRGVQAAFAGVAVVLSLGVAVWRLRGWQLVFALLATGLVSLGWLTLLGAFGEQTCLPFFD
jgi:hypothetical protein